MTNYIIKGNVEQLMGMWDALDAWKDPVLNRIVRINFIEKVKLKQKLNEFRNLSWRVAFQAGVKLVKKKRP